MLRSSSSNGSPIRLPRTFFSESSGFMARGHDVLDGLLEVTILYGSDLFSNSPLVSILQLLLLDDWVALSLCHRLKHLEMLAVVAMACKHKHQRDLESQIGWRNIKRCDEACRFCCRRSLGFNSGCRLSQHFSMQGLCIPLFRECNFNRSSMGL